jgi:hypothetical protein
MTSTGTYHVIITKKLHLEKKISKIDKQKQKHTAFDAQKVSCSLQ